MADKKLNITADLKVKTNDAERVLQRLQKEGVKISNVLKGLDLNTNNGRAGFAKSLLTANKEMVKLRGTTQDTAKVMEHVYGRQMERHTKNIDKYTKKIDDLNKRFKTQQYNAQFQREIGNEAGATKYSGAMDRTANKILVNEAAKQATQAALSDLKGGGNNPGGGGFNVDSARIATAVAQSIAGALGNMGGIIQSSKTLASGNLAASRSYEANMIGKMRGGDFSDLVFGAMKRDGETNLERGQRRAGGLKAGYMQVGAQIVGGALQAGQGALTLSAGGSGSGGPGGRNVMTGSDPQQAASGIMGGIGTMYQGAVGLGAGNANVAAIQAQQAELENYKNQNPMMQAILGNLQATAGMRVGAAKALQGRHMAAYGTGAGYGLDMGESFGLAQGLSRQFGMNGMFGSSTTRTRTGGVGFGGLSERDALNTQASGMESLIMNGQKVGSVEEYRKMRGLDLKTGQHLGTISETTRSRGLMSSVLDLERMGLDRSVAGGALGTMTQASGGSVDAGYKKLEDVMTKAFGRGVRDARLGEEIVKAAAERSFGAGGAQDSGAIGMMLSGGLNGKSTLRDVQNNVSGFQNTSDLFQNNQYFRALGAGSAANSLGGKGDGIQMMLATKASMDELAGGSQSLNAAGISPEQRKQMLKDRVNSLMGTFLGGSNASSVSGLKNSLDANGGDIEAVMKSKQNAFGGFSAQFANVYRANGLGTFEQGMGFARDLQGFGATADSGGKRQNFAQHGDGNAESQVRAQQKIVLDLLEREAKAREVIVPALEADSKKIMDQAASPTSGDFKSFNDFLGVLNQVLRQAYEQSKTPKGGGKGH